MHKYFMFRELAKYKNFLCVMAGFFEIQNNAS